jgi:hypothetical protein
MCEYAAGPGEAAAVTRLSCPGQTRRIGGGAFLSTRGKTLASKEASYSDNASTREIR